MGCVATPLVVSLEEKAKEQREGVEERNTEELSAFSSDIVQRLQREK